MKKIVRKNSRRLMQTAFVTLVVGIGLIWYSSHQQSLKADSLVTAEQGATLFGGVLAIGFLVIAISAFLFILAISQADEKH